MKVRKEVVDYIKRNRDKFSQAANGLLEGKEASFEEVIQIRRDLYKAYLTEIERLIIEDDGYLIIDLHARDRYDCVASEKFTSKDDIKNILTILARSANLSASPQSLFEVNGVDFESNLITNPYLGCETLYEAMLGSQIIERIGDFEISSVTEMTVSYKSQYHIKTVNDIMKIDYI